MKFSKILFVALAAVAMTACSDTSDEDARDYDSFLGHKVNSVANVSVSLPATFSVDENEEVFFVPVNVTGETNGKVEVTVQVKTPANIPAGCEPAKVIEHFNVTSYTVNIAPGVAQGGIEMTNVWETGVINDDRVFEVSIVGAKGATVGSNATCLVTIVNVDDPYTSMCGKWKLTCTNMRDGSDAAFTIDLKTVAPGTDDYGHVLYGFGINDKDYLIPFVNFDFDVETGKGTMEIGYGWMMTDGKAFNYGDPVGAAFPVCMYRSSQGLTMDHTAVCTFDSNYKEIVFPEDANIVLGLFGYPSQEFTGYNVGYFGNFKMTR